jgi:hypothetical protein
MIKPGLHIRIDSSPGDLSDPRKTKDLSEWGEVAIAVYGLVCACTRVPSDLTIAVDRAVAVR